DYEKGILALRLGGPQLLNLLHRSAGFPHTRTVQRHTFIPQLQASAGLPLNSELCYNLEATSFSSLSRRTGATLMFDEIALKKALRLDIRRNQVLGLCREHTSKHCSVDFTSYEDAEAIHQALCSGKVHLASEATVIAIGAFSGNAQAASMRTIAVSGSCKREDALSHAVLIERALEACTDHPKVRIYCVATDGDARRRQAIASLTLGRKPEHNSSLHEQLGNLPLFNALCGKDDVTACTDKKHNDKRCRNTLLRRKGTTILGVHITLDTIEQHLTHITPDNPFCRETPGVLSPSAAAACLNPNDRQNVSLAFKLLSGIASLRTPLPCDSPNFALKRRVLNLMGALYKFLLDPITDTQMSLRGQLTNLSAASLVVLALYSANRGDFMPTQLYYDIQTYVKCAYFCVAKIKNDDPAGQFFLSQMGTDRLESGFGHVRTMVGGDSNADQLQLMSRLGALAECSALFDDHPEWDTTSRRLKYGGLRSALSDTSRRVDHLGPVSWSGDTYVSNVNLKTCWQQGLLIATSVLEAAGITVPFDEMIEAKGFDILCPFGK
ncbi:hypothetical protein BDV93DRAFT_404414, partial [Ceratobasidium sp. AG-I]